MMGKLQMDREWTEQDLRTFAEGAQAAFETVLLDELPQDTGWQDEGLQVSYSLCNGRVSCVLRRTVRETASCGGSPCLPRWQATCCRRSA